MLLTQDTLTLYAFLRTTGHPTPSYLMSLKGTVVSMGTAEALYSSKASRAEVAGPFVLEKRAGNNTGQMKALPSLNPIII